MVQRLEIDIIAFGSVPARILVGTFLDPFNANARLSIYFQDCRAYTMVKCKHAAWFDARTTAKDFWHPHPACAM